MKNLFAGILLAGLLSAGIAAPKAGAQLLTVDYRVTFNPDCEEIRAQVDKNKNMGEIFTEVYRNLVLTYRLTYKDGQSEFRALPATEKQMVKIMGIDMDLSQFSSAYSKNYTYKDHKEGIILDKVQLPTKSFVVTDTIGSEQYTLSEDGETREILGHICRKAVSSDGETTAWITSDYPVDNEPINCGLDGLILRIDEDSMNFIAIEITETADHDPVRPEAKKTLTKAEFETKYNK